MESLPLEQADDTGSCSPCNRRDGQRHGEHYDASMRIGTNSGRIVAHEERHECLSMTVSPYVGVVTAEREAVAGKIGEAETEDLRDAAAARAWVRRAGEAGWHRTRLLSQGNRRSRQAQGPSTLALNYPRLHTCLTAYLKN